MHKAGEADPYVCYILYNGYIVLGKQVNDELFGPVIIIFDKKGVFYGYFKEGKPVEGTIILNDARYQGTFDDKGCFIKGTFNYKNQIFVHINNID